MNEEKLKEIGLNDDQVKKVLAEFKTELDGKYVTKEVFNAKNEELKTQKEEVSKRDEQIKNLEKFTKDNEELKTQIETIKTENANAKAEYEKALAQERLSNTIRNSILEDKEFKPHDIEMVISQLKLDNIKLEDNKLVGFKEQFDSLKKEKGFLFTKVETTNDSNNKFKGFTPFDGKDSNDTNSNDTTISFAKSLAAKTLAAKGIKVENK